MNDPLPPVLPADRKVLLYLGYPPDTGFAITRLARAFRAAASAAVGSDDLVVTGWAAPHATGSVVAPGEVLVDSRLERAEGRAAFEQLLQRERVWAMLGLDLPIRSAHVDLARRAGAASVVSYWGAPMSSERPPLVRRLKALQTRLATGRPDHFVFESEAMRRTGVEQLGIPATETSVVGIGVDVARFGEAAGEAGYSARTFGFPADRRVIVYSGHFEARKGVAVIVKAALELVDRRQRTDVHFVLAGNRSDEEAAPYRALLAGSRAREHVTFAGYRHDLPAVFADASVGCIASVGWDSLTVSAIEMQASGLPVVVSALQGLPEAIVPGATGLTFPPGDEVALAATLEQLLDAPARRDEMARAARRYATRHGTAALYESRLAEVLRQQFLRQRGRWRAVNAWGAVS